MSFSQSSTPLKKKPLKKNQISNFISKTFKILQDKDNFQVISWTDNGNSFIVKDKQKFQSTILPRYFKHSKFSSFVRQLNMYDFHKLRKQKEIQVFKHKYFKMNKKELLKKIKRKCLEENQDNGDNQEDQMIGIGMGSMGNGGGMGEMGLAQVRRTESEKGVEKQSIKQAIAKQNQELYRQIENYQMEIKQFEEIRGLRRQKLVKIINAALFDDDEQSEEDIQQPQGEVNQEQNNKQNGQIKVQQVSLQLKIKEQADEINEDILLNEWKEETSTRPVNYEIKQGEASLGRLTEHFKNSNEQSWKFSQYKKVFKMVTEHIMGNLVKSNL